MTISLTGAGSFSVRVGHLLGRIADVNALRGGAATARVLSGANMPALLAGAVLPDFAAGTALPQAIDGLQTAMASWQAGQAAYLLSLAAAARNALLAMYAVDVQGSAATDALAQLVSGFTAAQAVTELIRQMNAAAATVQAATASAGAATAVGSPSGNPVIAVSIKNGQGVNQQLMFPETITLRCTVDSQQVGGSLLNNEIVTAYGQAAVADPLSQAWPGGSGAIKALSAVAGGNSNTRGNLAYNGSFGVFTNANLPDNFTAGAGSVGAQILDGAGTTYLSGGGSVEFVGDGATLTGLTQSFSTAASTGAGAGGTPAVLFPDAVYHGCLFYKLSSASPAAGVLQASLTDGSAYPGAVVNDDQGAANTVTAALTGVADTSWHALPWVFRTPAVLPTTSPAFKLRLRLSTALSAGTNVYLSNLTFTAAVQVYAGGPFVSVHAGSSRLIAGVNPDAWTVAVANSYSASGSGLFQQYFERIFGLRALGLQLPAAASSPTILDSCIA